MLWKAHSFIYFYHGPIIPFLQDRKLASTNKINATWSTKSMWLLVSLLSVLAETFCHLTPGKKKKKKPQIVQAGEASRGTKLSDGSFC